MSKRIVSGVEFDDTEEVKRLTEELKKANDKIQYFIIKLKYNGVYIEDDFYKNNR